ncbi:MAG: hypothetical protein QOJ31_847 [Gaiellales bacterium]|jgi:hypothetical protein|nr:hypothetical protein [Gaiellales bacterium]MDX6545443.1 hypothetical protein [Gaiellales bacterium]MDX6550163.1 hypothetical protein [Gaiellales bacterium]
MTRRPALILGAGLAAATLIAVGLHLASERDNAVRALNAARTQNVRLTSQLATAERRSNQLTAALHQAQEQTQHAQSCAGGFAPHGVVVPDHGPVGTRVSLVIDCLRGFEDAITQPAYGVFLIRDFGMPGGCELIAGGPSRIRLLEHGRAAGWFTVSRHGGCFQSQGETRSVSPGTYGIGVGCHACEVATFTVTRS